MCETGASRVALARVPDIDERAVRPPLACSHRTHIDQIEAALANLRERPEITVRGAA